MIHMITVKNRDLYEQQLSDMFSLRRVHFVEERGWTALSVVDGKERDQFDDDRTIYFLALDARGRIELSMRARPTDDRSMLGDIFPHLLAPTVEPVQAKGVWEISRIFATRAARGRRGIQRRSELFLATLEAARAAGVDRLVGMTDVFLLPQTLSAGWRVKVMGLPSAYEEGEVIAVEVDSGDAGLRAMQERLAVRRSVVMHLGPDHPLAALGPAEAEALYAASESAGRHDIAFSAALSSRIAELNRTLSDEDLEELVNGVVAAMERLREARARPAFDADGGR